MNKKTRQHLSQNLPKQNVRIHLLLAKLLEDETIKQDDFYIRSKGTRSRAYLKEVITCEYKKIHPGKSLERLLIDVSQEGIYDMLPSGLFNEQTHSDPYDTIDSYAKETKKRRSEQEKSRQFFLPFEQEMHRLRIAIEQQEQLDTTTINNPIVRKIFKSFWKEEAGELSESDIDIIVYLLPLAHKIATNLALIELSFATVLQEKVKVSRVAPKELDIPKELLPTLGRANLGKDFILGKKIAETVAGIHLTIGPVYQKKLDDYLPGQQKAILLWWLRRFFTPFECSFSYNITTKKQAIGFILNKKSHLGYSTILG